MKNIFTYSLIACLLVVHTACDENFDELNTNKTSATSIDPIFELNTAIHQFVSSGTYL